MTTKRTDRVISVNGSIHDKLTAVQSALVERFGFKPTLAQTIEYLTTLIR